AGASAVVIGNPDNQIGLYGAAALLGIGLVMAIYIKPSLGAEILIIAVFTNISRTLTDSGLPGVIKPLVAIVAVAILMRNINAGSMLGGRKKTGGIEFFLILFFIITVISYVAADNKARAIEVIVDLGKDIVIIYCIFAVLRNPQTWKRSAWIIITATAFLCLLGGYQVISGNYDQEFFGLAQVIDDVGESSTTARIAGPIKEPNIWAQIVVAVVPLVLFRIIYEPRTRTKLLAVGILGILLFEVLNSYSRGAYLALAIIFVLVALGQRLHPLIWFAGLAAVVLALPFLPASYTERFLTLSLLSPTNPTAIYQEDSFRSRSSEMLTGFNMFIQNPLLGVGAGNYPNNYQKYTADLGLEWRSGERQPHSLYSQILAETGIVGGIAFIGFAFLLLTSLSRTRQSIENLAEYQSWEPWISAIQLTIIGYLISSIFLHGEYLRFFWIFTALALSAIQLTEESLIDRDQNPSLEIPI
ncbi:MAG: O-antigen ligase family protein, partial [Anaerolineales bacterium]|nr:O-antigen ligase family protein [Anaerolineales bacterium]